MSHLIEFEHVTKEFVLRRPHNRSLRANLISLVQSRLPGHTPPERELFIALQDVGFTIKGGETVGFIGRNGAGKSTILKLITRIIAPTSGRVKVEGRVAALLELGAGFHPELTGRENIYLNGSILGMREKEIDRKLDEIVAFTEIEPFIDMPVKHYSSGMYMRLGFAVAVHVDPEILLIDEVLAVGDEYFQRKCLERINSMRHSGVTIVFVSHSMDAVRKLCTRVLWLDHSRIREDGPMEQVANLYSAYMLALETPAHKEQQTRFGSYEVEITGVEFLDRDGQKREEFKTDETFVARIHYHAHERVPSPVFGIAIVRSDGMHVTGPNTDFSGYHIPYVQGDGAIELAIERLPLLEGNYNFTAAVYDEARIRAYDSHNRMYTFRVVPGGVREQYGLVRLPVEWRLAENGSGPHD